MRGTVHKFPSWTEIHSLLSRNDAGRR